MTDAYREELYKKFDRDIQKRKRSLRLLLAIDQLLNVLWWNGSQDETISSNIGRHLDSVNWFSKLVCRGLRLIESGHCLKSRGE